MYVQEEEGKHPKVAPGSILELLWDPQICDQGSSLLLPTPTVHLCSSMYITKTKIYHKEGPLIMLEISCD